MLRLAIGSAELLLALLLPFLSLSAYGLIFIMSGALVSHYRVDAGVTSEMVPAAVLLCLLVLLAVLRLNDKRNEDASHLETDKKHE